MLIDLPLAIRYFSVSGAIAAIDFGMMVGFAVLALRADRYWPIIMAALQLVMILGHLIKWLDSELIRRTYIILIAYPAWLHLLVLMVATIRHMRRSAMAGPQSAIT